MSLDLSRYPTLISDCDGVLLDSNQVKTEAFYKTALPWCEAAANALVNYHIANGGISRYDKFSYFIDVILPGHSIPRASESAKPKINQLITSYGKIIRSGLMTCSVANGLSRLRAATSQARWLIISGADQTELRTISFQRGLSSYFDAGIFGGPDSKQQILARESSAGSIYKKALFLGDSIYDYRVAFSAGIDFLFVSGWTECPDWRAYLRSHQISSVAKLSDLIP